MARDWHEKDHPRNPEDGQFVDKASAGRWASRISDAIGRMRGEPGRSREQRRMADPNAFMPGRGGTIRHPDETPGSDPDPGDIRFALQSQVPYIRQTDLDALSDEMIMEAIDQAKEDAATNPPEGISFDEFVVDQLTQLLRHAHPSELWPHLSEEG